MPNMDSIRLKTKEFLNQPINSRLQLFARDFSFLHGISHFCTEIPSRFKKNCTLINQSEYSIFEQYVISTSNRMVWRAITD